jgi:hypothetical protein
MNGSISMNSITGKIASRVRAKRRGWVFTPKAFLDIGTRASVDQTLSRLVQRGMIRRLDRGVYDYPKQHVLLGTLSPDADSLAQAAASQSGNGAFPSGALAANMLGLSAQVPAKPVYLTNGLSRAKKIAGRMIILKHARVPLFDHLSDNANLALQALSYLGKGSIDDRAVSLCANRMTDRDLRDLSSAADQVPGWMSDLILKIQQAKHGQIRNQA